MEVALACSQETIQLPLGYIGFAQTKGTLARHFVMAQFSDAQIEPGFVGKITLELVNLSPFTISLPAGSNIAQLFIAKCTTKNTKAYMGKYCKSDVPTIPRPHFNKHG